MNYVVHITQTAGEDLASAVDYISHVLFQPQAARDLLDEAEQKLSSLSVFPEQYAVSDDPVLKSWGVRFVVIRNYLAFYILSEPEQTVSVIRFLYRKRNWSHILRQGFSAK